MLVGVNLHQYRSTAYASSDGSGETGSAGSSESS